MIQKDAMITFIYDGVRMPGNIGTMIRNGDLLLCNYKHPIKHIIISPENDHKISWFKSIVMNFIGWVCDLLDLNKRISLNNNFGPDGKFNAKARRDIKRFACLSKNGSYSELLFDPQDLEKLIDNNVVFSLDNSPDSLKIDDLKSTLLEKGIDKDLTFVIGGESTGISERMLSRSNYVVSIPTRKGISINVSNAQGILCYEINKVFK